MRDKSRDEIRFLFFRTYLPGVGYVKDKWHTYTPGITFSIISAALCVIFPVPVPAILCVFVIVKSEGIIPKAFAASGLIVSCFWILIWVNFFAEL